jgi:hypothetical protein
VHLEHSSRHGQQDDELDAVWHELGHLLGPPAARGSSSTDLALPERNPPILVTRGSMARRDTPDRSAADALGASFVGDVTVAEALGEICDASLDAVPAQCTPGAR